jgi:hypothetical protein
LFFILGIAALLHEITGAIELGHSLAESRKAASSMDENQIVSFFEQALDPKLDANRALALFGDVEDKHDSTWRVRPKPQIIGVREILFEFFQRDQRSSPADIELVLATSWNTTVERLEKLFAGTLRWAPPGPSVALNRTASIDRDERQGRLEGMVMFELDQRVGQAKGPNLKVLSVRFRRLGETAKTRD